MGCDGNKRKAAGKDWVQNGKQPVIVGTQINVSRESKGILNREIKTVITTEQINCWFTPRTRRWIG
jgi:hypothetical protein